MSQSINLAELTKKIENENLHLIDVREVDEYKAGHIPSVSNIPLSEFNQRLAEFDPHETYYLICHSGGRSAMAGMMLSQIGIEAINVQGGMSQWRGPIE